MPGFIGHTRDSLGLIGPPAARLTARPESPTYASILAYRSGDLLTFYGCGLPSRAISLWTQGPSHIGQLCERADQLALFESTTLSDLPCILCGIATQGVQAVPALERICRYNGSIYQLRLRRPLEDREVAKLLGFLTAQDQLAYALFEAMTAARWGRWFWSPHNTYTRWFCSQLIIAALQHIGRLDPLTHASAWRPSDVARRLVQLRIYEPPRLVKAMPSLFQKGYMP